MGRGSSKTGALDLGDNMGAINFFNSPPPPGGASGEWDRNITEDERMSIIGYTGSDFEYINAALRGGDMDSYIEHQVDEIDSGISKFNLKQDIKVYRGVDSLVVKQALGTTDPDEINANFKGGVFKDNGFMSTSTNKQKTFSGAQFEISVKRGRGKGAFVAPISSFKSESEFLLKRGTELKITGASYKGGRLHIQCEC